jgi:beta-mannosidase
VLIDSGWEVQREGDAEWLPARVPGTAAAALGDLDRDYDADTWIFRTRFAGDGEVLHFDGIATVADVWLNGERILESSSMFARHAVDVAGRLRPEGNELEIRCHALAPLLAERRTPRPRWKTRLASGNLRWFRTMLLGRAPGFAPGPAAVGPWRPVRLEPRREAVRLRTRLEGDDGVVEANGEEVARIPNAERWWPHTHGDPVLHEVQVGDGVVRVGFRELGWNDPGLTVNGVRIFARGAVWTPADFVSLAPSRAGLRAALEQVRDAGMNMLRLPGTGCYESPDFFDLCDELGILVWQDFMFANMDYPIEDAGFRALVEQEARDVLEDVAWRPSLAVLCGNSEVEQQVAMLGLDPALGRGELFGELLPRWAREAGADAPYVPSAPSGGDLPFRTDTGVANYYGVGGYRRRLQDARLANVRFAAECLGFANVPDDHADGFVPRDAGADWDFADVRRHYLRLLYGERDDVETERSVTGEVMAEVFGEWRRRESPCDGGLVLWLRDLVPGSGWGVVDANGRPKLALHHLRRALAPLAVWTTDEGLNGVDIHVANDGAERISAQLRVALYADGERRVDEVTEPLVLEPHSVVRRNVESMLGRFVDASYVYRFGPPQQDTIVASLEREGELLSQAFRFPVERPAPVDDLGIEATRQGDRLTIRARKLVHGVRIHGLAADDDGFCVEPGHERVVAVRGNGGRLTALNLHGSVEL